LTEAKTTDKVESVPTEVITTDKLGTAILMATLDVGALISSIVLPEFGVLNAMNALPI
jgi:uncharacterized membrane protein YdcZ (DUF606 family)